MDNHGRARVAHTRRTKEERQQELELIYKYKAIIDSIRDEAARGSYRKPRLFSLTSAVLQINPEYYTVWNVRRRCLTSGSLSRCSAGSSRSRASPSTSPSSSDAPTTPPNPGSRTTGPSGTTADATSDGIRSGAEEVLQSELQFTIPLLLWRPKCYWIWKHRNWILEQAILLLPRSVASGIWQAELALTSTMLDKDCRNFHAWGYRRSLVARLESADLLGESLAEAEFAYTTQMIKKDLSNFSAWHNRSRLMHRVLDERGADDAARAAFLKAELELIQDALNVGPEDQSLWYYHRFLMAQVFGSDDGMPTVAPNLKLDDRILYLQQQIEFIKDLLEDFPDIKWPYEALLEYTSLQASGGSNRRDSDGEKEEEEEKDGPLFWLGKLRELDPMQKGRWDDLQRQIRAA
ncbi:protein prenylyltransferase [Xylariaceae sp. FL0594]|nr:protein prenylyltransferase [Xylariaceae sp. FL0594]